MSIEGTQSPEMILTALGVIKRTCEEYYKKDIEKPCKMCPLFEESFNNRNICKVNNNRIPSQWEITPEYYEHLKNFLGDE